METERMLEEIKEVEESQDFDKAMCLAKYLAWEVIEKTAYGRTVERTAVKVCGMDKMAEIWKNADEEYINGEPFTKKEKEVYDELFTIWD